MKDQPYGLTVGIDWGDAKHDFHLHWADGARCDEAIEAKPQAVLAWLEKIHAQLPTGQKAAMILEQSHGALFLLLAAQDWIDLYPVNPEALANYRKSFYNSRAKSDPSDAQLAEQYLDLHRQKLRLYQPATEAERKMDAFCRQRRKILGQALEQSNQLRSLLKDYYPVVSELFKAELLRSSMGLDFLGRWPTLVELKKAKSQTLRSFFYKHNCRSQSLLEQRLQAIQEAGPVTTDPAVIEPAVMLVRHLVSQLRSAQKTIAEFDHRIGQLFQAHPDCQLFESLPGAGRQLAPRLACAFGSDRSRWSEASHLQKRSGIAPVTEQSGKSRWVHRRLFRPRFLCQTFHEFAANSIPHSTWAAAYYRSQIEKGKSHHTAVRALAFKWIRVVFACWNSHQLYDENRFLYALQTRNSPITLFIQQFS